MSRGIAAAGWVLLGAALVTGCGQDDKPAPKASAPAPGAPAASAPPASPPAATSSPAPPAAPAGLPGGDATKGRQIWLSQCVACHNSDPSKDGPVGPAVKGSSAPLLEARLQRASYPEGYKPKRDSKVMPARPDLVASVPDLAAFLR